MNEQLAYLKAIVEGASDIEPWVQWFERNDVTLAQMLSRGLYLRLKQRRIAAIPEVLALFSVPFVPSERYAWLAGVEGLCRECGAKIERKAAWIWCPNGCFKMHVLYRDD
jgi:hypothetical protein